MRIRTSSAPSRRLRGTRAAGGGRSGARPAPVIALMLLLAGCTGAGGSDDAGTGRDRGEAGAEVAGEDEAGEEETEHDENFSDQATPPPYEEVPRSASRAPASPTQMRVDAWLDGLDDRGLAGQLVMLRVFGGQVDEADPRNEALYGVSTPREVIETLRPGGVILFRSDAGRDTGNLSSPRQVRAFTDDLREVSEELGPPLLVGIDQEGGKVDRIGHFGTPYPSARALDGDLDLAAEHAEITATELAGLGIDVNFAPVADVDTEASNPIIGDRAFSDDPEEVADYVVTQLDAYDGSGVAAGLKHFPGHGDTTEDSHLTLPRVDADLDQLSDRELVPFARAIEHGADAIMTAHLELPEISGPGTPSSLSPAVVDGLLREELGFDGVIVTDSLEMAGARQGRPDDRVALHALLAGHDLLVLPPAPEASVELLRRGLDTQQLDPDRVEASVRRLLRLKTGLKAQRDERPGHGVVGDGPQDTGD
jgi:beta-N-acetylhexosaminidase